MALSGAHTADTVPQVNAIYAARALYWAMTHGKGDSIALPQRDYLRPGLHTRALLR
jgi:hypothetical protein